jgi:hypothetical protein
MDTPCNYEHLSADELRLLQNMLNTDRKTIDFIESVVSGLDMTERRATAGVLILKIRRMLDRVLSDEMEERRKALAAQAEIGAQLGAPPAAPKLTLVPGAPQDESPTTAVPQEG